MNERSETDREASFVAQMVEILIARFKSVLYKSHPRPNNSVILRSTDDEKLKAAFAQMSRVNEIAKEAQKKAIETTAAFNKQFGKQANDLVNAKHKKWEESLNKQIDDFEFKIRTAIGLVELVSPVDAFNVIEDARREIRDMGFTYRDGEVNQCNQEGFNLQ